MLSPKRGLRCWITTGDLAHRGRRAQLEAASPASLEATGRLRSWPCRATTTSPTRSRPVSRAVHVRVGANVSGRPIPSYRSDTLGRRRPQLRATVAPPVGPAGCPERLERAGSRLAAGLTRSGALSRRSSATTTSSGSPWRAPSQAAAGTPRGRSSRYLTAAGAELVVGGHIHQASIALRREFEAFNGDEGASLVLATAPGAGRPRPHRRGEAQGLLLNNGTRPTWRRDECLGTG